MATVEERLAFVEGRLQELAGGYGQLREDVQRVAQHVVHLDQKVDRLREELSGRIEGLDHRLSGRIDALEQKVERYRDQLSTQFADLDGKLSRWVRWLVGMFAALLLGQVVSLTAVLLR